MSDGETTEVLINAMMKGDWTLEEIVELFLDQGLVEAPEGLTDGKPFSITRKGTDVFGCLLTLTALLHPTATRNLLTQMAEDDALWDRLDDD